MRLGTVRTEAGSRAAVWRAEGVAIVDGYADAGALLQDGARGLEAARAAERGGSTREVATRDILRPVLAPGAVVCVGLNYRGHILEMGRELPTSPTLFSKLPRALADPFADVPLPEHSVSVDWEGELAFVIGKPGRDVAVADGWDYVAGLTVFNDVSARDFQRRTLQWFAGKTFQNSSPFGPWLVTPDEVGDLGSKKLTVTVNGEVVQHDALDELVFDVPMLVSDISRIVELQPGDIIATGTPAGVGDSRGQFLQDGDVVSVEIDGIGAIRNTFRSAAGSEKSS